MILQHSIVQLRVFGSLNDKPIIFQPYLTPFGCSKHAISFVEMRIEANVAGVTGLGALPGFAEIQAALLPNALKVETESGEPQSSFFSKIAGGLPNASEMVMLSPLTVTLAYH